MAANKDFSSFTVARASRGTGILPVFTAFQAVPPTFSPPLHKNSWPKPELLI